MQIVVPRVENEPGRVMTISDEASWPLPDTTYQYTATPFLDGRWQNAVANEMGVAVTGSITCYVRDEIAALDPTVENGLSETWLCGLVGACCTTAREGVELLAEVIETIGNSEQNTILKMCIRDRFEAVWGERYIDANNTVMTHIARLREKLGEPSRRPKFIKTVWGVGYTIEK